MNTLIRSKYVAIILALFSFGASAAGIDSLEKGFYLPPDVGCSGIGGAAGMYFDGSDFSGHYQVCKTFKLEKKDTYRTDCLEGQGSNWPSKDEIENSPDKTSTEMHIVVKSKKSFIMNDTTYNYCGSSK